MRSGRIEQRANSPVAPPSLSSDTGLIDGGRTEIKHATWRDCTLHHEDCAHAGRPDEPNWCSLSKPIKMGK